MPTWTMMFLALLSLAALPGCPYVPLVREEPLANRPPRVVVADTTPYNTTLNVTEGSYLSFTLAVEDADTDDDLDVKVLKEPQYWPEAPYDVLYDLQLTPSDSPPEKDASYRWKQFDLHRTPCPAGSAPSRALIWVCVSDTGYINSAEPVGPCEPKGDGYVDGYPVVINCVEP